VRWGHDRRGDAFTADLVVSVCGEETSSKAAVLRLPGSAVATYAGGTPVITTGGDGRDPSLQSTTAASASQVSQWRRKFRAQAPKCTSRFLGAAHQCSRPRSCEMRPARGRGRQRFAASSSESGMLDCLSKVGKGIVVPARAVEAATSTASTRAAWDDRRQARHARTTWTR